MFQILERTFKAHAQCSKSFFQCSSIVSNFADEKRILGATMSILSATLVQILNHFDLLFSLTRSFRPGFLSSKKSTWSQVESCLNAYLNGLCLNSGLRIVS